MNTRAGVFSVFAMLATATCDSTNNAEIDLQNASFPVMFAGCEWQIPEDYVKVAKGEFNKNLSFINMLDRIFDQSMLYSPRKKDVITLVEDDEVKLFRYTQVSGENEYLVHIFSTTKAYVRFAGLTSEEVLSVSRDCI